MTWQVLTNTLPIGRDDDRLSRSGCRFHRLDSDGNGDDQLLANSMKKFLVCLLFLAVAGSAFAQSQSVRQSGNVTPKHPVMWTTNGVIQDAGTAAEGFLTSLGVTASGPGICQNSGPITGPYQQICLGVTLNGGALITAQNFGGATALPLTFNINGVPTTIPSGTIVTGVPPFVSGTVTCFSGTQGAIAGCTAGAWTLFGNPSASIVAPAPFSISSLAFNPSPAGSTDRIMVQKASDGSLYWTTPSTIAGTNIAGVSTFNGRSGAVVPGAADYTAPQIAYTATNGVTRTTASKVSDIASVLDFGADPTGAVDSTSAFALAIANADHVLIPCGKYKLTNITLPSSTGHSYWLDGQGRTPGDSANCTQLFWAGGVSSGANFINIGGAPTYSGQGYKISGLTINGNGAAQSNTGACIYIDNVRSVKLFDILISQCFSDAVVVSDSGGHLNFGAGADILSTTIENWGVSGSGNAIKIGIYIYDVSIIGSDIYQTSSVPSTVNQNSAAINHQGAGNCVQIANNNINGNGIQIYIAGNVCNTITGNSIHVSTSCTAAADGIVLNGTGGVTGLPITGNNFFALCGAAVHAINGASKNVICGNSVNVGDAPLTPAYGMVEDATSKNTYCGNKPTDGNTFIGSFGTSEYLINGPAASTGTVSVAGCTANACTDSTDFSGSFVTGSSVTQSIVSFGNTFVSAPSCVFTPQNNVGAAFYAYGVAVGTSGFQVGFSTAVTTQTIAYQCSGKH